MGDAVVGRTVGLGIDTEFEAQLASWVVEYRGRPKEELTRLLLLALEREQLVSVAYRDRVMDDRLEGAPIDDDRRKIARQCLAWAWRDEEMHAIYTRGVLLRIGGPWLRWLAWSSQLAGAIAGWAASVKHHATIESAPISRTIASLVVLAGRIGGKVPRGMRDKLVHLSLKAYCELQVEAERTAELAWRRITELSVMVPGLPEGASAWFGRMAADEDRHRRIFERLAASIDDHDRPIFEAARLIEDVRVIGELFLPRAHRSGGLADHPLGGGGVVAVQEAPAHAGKRGALRTALVDAGLSEVVSARAAALGKPVDSLKVIIKTSFMLGYDRKDTSHLTDPELLDELGQVLAELGVKDPIVAEGGNLYDGFYSNRSVAEVGAYFGYASSHYRLVDLDLEQVPHEYSRGMAQSTIARSWRDADLRICFAKARSHPTDLTHLVIGSIQGVGARLEEFLFAERFAHRETALLMPLADFPLHFAMIDAFDSAADGLVGILGCSDPPSPRRIYAGADALAVDLIATRHLGIDDPLRSPILRIARDWFGDPLPNTRIVGVDRPVPGFRGPYANELSSLMSLLAYPVWEFASGRGAAFLPAMDTRAFPPKSGHGTGPLWVAYRALMQGLLGLAR